MPITPLNTTTLTNALSDSGTRRFLVGSTSNITAGDVLLIDQEQMKVQAVPASGEVEVFRGHNGTEARDHAAASRITIIATLTDAGIVNSEGQTELAGEPPPGTPNYTLPIGSRRRDAAGNEYILCAFGSAVYGRQPVEISDAFVASALGTTGRGRVGVVAEAGATSDQGGWVQVYGRCLMQIGMSGVSPSDAANGPTTLSTSVMTRFILQTSATTPASIGWVSDVGTTDARHFVKGIHVASDASPGDVSAVTSAASHTGSQIAVFLNYPVIEYDAGLITS